MHQTGLVRWWLCPYRISDLSHLAITADPEQLWLQQELGQQECAAGAQKGAALHLSWRSWGKARSELVLSFSCLLFSSLTSRDKPYI